MSFKLEDPGGSWGNQLEDPGGMRWRLPGECRWPVWFALSFKLLSKNPSRQCLVREQHMNASTTKYCIVCLFVCLFICLFVSLFVCLFVSMLHAFFQRPHGYVSHRCTGAKQRLPAGCAALQQVPEQRLLAGCAALRLNIAVINYK